MNALLKSLAAVGVLLSSMTLSAQTSEPTPESGTPSVPAERTLRVSFAQNQKMTETNLMKNINDWTVPASAETGWCNIIPSRFKVSGKISHTAVTVAPRVLRWTDGTLSPLSVHI